MRFVRGHVVDIVFQTYEYENYNEMSKHLKELESDGWKLHNLNGNQATYKKKVGDINNDIS